MEFIKKQPIDIIKKILSYCNITSQINLISTCKKFNNILYDFDLLNISIFNKINNLFVESNKKLEFTDIINLPYFNNWLLGFTMAEGSFHIKARGTAHFSIVQSDIENSPIIKAIHYFIKGPES